jgi:mono/diheme cytochrome c family protein
MKTRITILTLLAVLAVGFAVAEEPVPTITEEPLTWKTLAIGDGEQLYGELCAVCHGDQGKGDGPAAPALRAVTPDLTMLAAKNDGVYPFDEVQRAINGEGQIIAHGSRQMPIWGTAFTDVRLDRKPAQRKAFARLRIYDLATYLETIQAP